MYIKYLQIYNKLEESYDQVRSILFRIVDYRQCSMAPKTSAAERLVFDTVLLFCHNKFSCARDALV